MAGVCGDDSAHRIEQRGRHLGVAGAQGAVRKDDIDLIGAILERRQRLGDDVGHRLGATREVGDRGDAHAGSVQGSRCQRDEARPHAHRCNASVRTVGADAEIDHVVGGCGFTEVGEVDQRQRSSSGRYMCAVVVHVTPAVGQRAARCDGARSVFATIASMISSHR